MDTVPSLFIESVLQRSGKAVRSNALKLSRAWGRLAKAFWQNGGTLELLYVPRERKGRFRYRLRGFALKSEVLSLEVAKDMSKTMSSISFHVYSFREDYAWKQVGPDQEDDVLELVKRLDAPTKELDFSPNQIDCYKDLVSNYSHVLRTFTSVKNVPNDPVLKPLLEDMISTGRLQSIDFYGYEPAILPASLLLDHFFNGNCRRLTLDVESISVPELVNRWKQMDPQDAPHGKIIDLRGADSDNFRGIKMDFLRLNHPRPAVFDRISKKFQDLGTIETVQRIKHPETRYAKVHVVSLSVSDSDFHYYSMLFE
uniref:F-box domain-containing protein n=1 Tax=Steinernema glaseri TaxID=37863 RepID=A0A1I7ZY92_9BILA